jgi:pantoate--beta-alanine ligase
MAPGERARVLTSIAEVRAAVAATRSSGGTVALVPTMGALHDGHLEHAARASTLADLVIVSIFVNPLQFGAGEDLDRYPRTLDADLDALAPFGVDAVFAPSVDEMYPDGRPETVVSAGRVGGMFEGAARHGHFDGVLTVVAKLLNIVEPDLVTFGQKDAQQLFLVDRMMRDLSVRARIERIETVREPDGLAMSSRNRFLSDGERRAARAIPNALEAAASASDRGLDAAIAAAQSALAGEKHVELGYLACVDPATFLPLPDDHRGPALVIIAARVGTTRLIDNELIRIG